jgi:uncharacterized protein
VSYMSGSGVKEDMKRAIGLFEKACEAGLAGGCLNLGLAHQHGDGVAKNLERAKALFKKGCEFGFVPACDAHRDASKMP